jgi:hypothetical protein
VAKAIGELQVETFLLRDHAVIVPLGGLMIAPAGFQLEEEISFLSIALHLPTRFVDGTVKLALAIRRQRFVMVNESCAVRVAARRGLTDLLCQVLGEG